MAIKIQIHQINVKSNTAIISLLDNDHVLIDRKRCINIKLNKDGSANTEFFKLYAKYITFQDRLFRLDKNEDDLL